ncbi:hypothetical protein [Williamsia sterculiae]|uniref:Uncharacterized protein n=1 Tax=Williamsia sterculiae TaxID=1344003 RepID=A0A1N7GF46_9NOCA|nr:hypothetical protein [Williamsia sterculiae]SIS11168.1 hypothetical protein SAMN05445060_2709 [Williamsia sterculiae]
MTSPKTPQDRIVTELKQLCAGGDLEVGNLGLVNPEIIRKCLGDGSLAETVDVLSNLVAQLGSSNNANAAQQALGVPVNESAGRVREVVATSTFYRYRNKGLAQLAAVILDYGISHDIGYAKDLVSETVHEAENVVVRKIEATNASPDVKNDIHELVDMVSELVEDHFQVINVLQIVKASGLLPHLNNKIEAANENGTQMFLRATEIMKRLRDSV